MSSSQAMATHRIAPPIPSYTCATNQELFLAFCGRNSPEDSPKEDLINKESKTQSQPTGRRSTRKAGWLTSSPNTTDLSSFARVMLMLSLIAWYMLQERVSSSSKRVARLSSNPAAPGALQLSLQEHQLSPGWSTQRKALTSSSESPSLPRPPPAGLQPSSPGAP